MVSSSKPRQLSAPIMVSSLGVVSKYGCPQRFSQYCVYRPRSTVVTSSCSCWLSLSPNKEMLSVVLLSLCFNLSVMKYSCQSSLLPRYVHCYCRGMYTVIAEVCTLQLPRYVHCSCRGMYTVIAEVCTLQSWLFSANIWRFC